MSSFSFCLKFLCFYWYLTSCWAGRIRRWADLSSDQCRSGITCTFDPLSDDWPLPGDMVVPMDPRDADPFVILPCPLGSPISNCRWSSNPPVTRWFRADNKDMFSYFMPDKKYGPDFTCPDPLLVSDYFSDAFDTQLTFKWFVTAYGYIIKVCFGNVPPTPADPKAGVKFECSSIYVDVAFRKREMTTTLPIPEHANIVRITATYNNARQCGKDDYLDIYDFKVEDNKPRIELDGIRRLRNLTNEFDQFVNENTHKCISDVESQLKYNDAVGMAGFFAYPIVQWVKVNGSSINSRFKMRYGERFYLKLPATSLLAVQLTPHRKSAALISNPIPCITGSAHDQASLTVKFWASTNVALTLCIRSHVTDEVFQCVTRKSSEFSFENKHSVVRFFLPTIRWTFELRLHFETEEENGFVILKSVDMEGEVCQNQRDCVTATNLTTISKMTNIQRILPCPTKSTGIKSCHWFAPKRYKAINDAYSFLFVNNGTYSNYSEFPFIYSRYFEAGPGRSLTFGYTASCIDFMLEVCFAHAVSFRFQHEKYDQLPCKRYLIQENEVNRDNRGIESIPETANRVFIALTHFGDPTCDSSTVSIYDLGVKEGNDD